MSRHLIDPERASADEGPFLVAASLSESAERVTAAHRHKRGQLFGALRGLLSVDTEEGQWVVPAIHAVWVPPHHLHGLRSHGAFSGWSVYVAESECADLPAAPRAIRTSRLLQEAVARACTWSATSADGPLDAAQEHIARVVLDEVRSLPEESLGLPMPRDPRALRIARALAAEPADRRRLDEWAASAGLATRTLSRHFIAETGFAFAEWRDRARTLRALEMLAAGESVKAVALEVGYETASAFIAMFKRTYGSTPTVFLDSQRGSA